MSSSRKTLVIIGMVFLIALAFYLFIDASRQGNSAYGHR